MMPKVIITCGFKPIIVPNMFSSLALEEGSQLAFPDPPSNSHVHLVKECLDSRRVTASVWPSRKQSGVVAYKVSIKVFLYLV